MGGCEKRVDEYSEFFRTRFYYAFDEKISLFPKDNTLLVKYADVVDTLEVREFLETEASSNLKLWWHDSKTVEIKTGSKEITIALKTKLVSLDEVYTCQPFYTLENGLDMGVTDEILVQFLPEISEESKTELFDTFETELIETTKIYQLLRVKRGADALKIANKIYETGLTEYSTPNFISYFNYGWSTSEVPLKK
jgi:hypothetical protein